MQLKKKLFLGVDKQYLLFWSSMVSLSQKDYHRIHIIKYVYFTIKKIFEIPHCVQISGGDDKKSPWIMMGHARDQT